MVAITRKLGEFDDAVRQALERAIGLPLRSDQQVMIQVFDPCGPQPAVGSTGAGLPDWSRVYDGLTDEQISAVEAQLVERPHLSRTIE
jgi:hypothetical protein